MLDVEPMDGVRKGGYEQCLQCFMVFFGMPKTKKGPSDER